MDIGVVKTSGEDDFLVAWINEVFLGFFIDNGPTFLVKGHWDPDMDPERDFIKLFMMCNQWNERSLTTKAFCHRDTQGLQVRVEFAVPTAEGLTDGQPSEFAGRIKKKHIIENIKNFLNTNLKNFVQINIGYQTNKTPIEALKLKLEF